MGSQRVRHDLVTTPPPQQELTTIEKIIAQKEVVPNRAVSGEGTNPAPVRK